VCGACERERGTLAVGLFNRGLAPATVTVGWSDLGIIGSQPVRDLWMRKDLGRYTGNYSATVPRHGVVFLKIGVDVSGDR
jgi:alpha-galactosidase